MNAELAPTAKACHVPTAALGGLRWRLLVLMRQWSERGVGHDSQSSIVSVTVQPSRVRLLSGLGLADGWMLERAKAAVKTIPLLGPAAVWCYRHLRQRPRLSMGELSFQREPLDGLDPRRISTAQIGNLLSYAKASGRRYGPSELPAGYQRIAIGGTVFPGQRDPAARLAKIPIDFKGKKILDIGCNAGGMLFPLQGVVEWGVGIDNDYKLINAANRIQYASEGGNLQFFVFDVEREPLGLVSDFLPEPKVDVIFLLAVCHWIGNWREVISFCASLSNLLVFESNGPDGKQEQQIAALREDYRSVTLLSDRSEDDLMFDRKMLLCEDSKHVA